MGRMTTGQKVIRTPVSFGECVDGIMKYKPMRGTVVYVHPKGRFHVVEFAGRGGKVRETFPGVEG